MYENFYGLKEKPFQIVPNPHYLYLSSVHENAVTYLEYGLMENVGFVLLTGDVGTGKTTLVRHIMDQFESEKDIAVIFNTNVSADQLICLVLQSCNLEPEAGNKTQNIEIFYEFLIGKFVQNVQVLLIIDEAQNLSDEALEEVRMLSNLQSDDQILVQIMLVGQPELKDRLMKPEHNAFAQRIAVNFTLTGLTDKETEAYISHRLKKAGGNPGIFSPEAIETIFKTSKGVPRTINYLCDAALVYGFGYEYETIDAPVIEQVIKDKGGMGLSVGKENNKPVFSFCYEALAEENAARLQKLESLVENMERQVAGLGQTVEKLQENLDGSLKDLLEKERKRNNNLLASYSALKVKYDNLLNLWSSKREISVSADKSTILLKKKS